MLNDATHNATLPDGSQASAVDQVVGSLRDLIRDQALIIGDVLPSEMELAASLGASRNTVREAIRILKAYGVVESRKKVGAVLTDRRQAAIMEAFSFAIDLSAETFRDIQGFRRLIEMNLFDMVAPALPQVARGPLLADMAALNAAMGTATDPLEAARLDYRFHKALIDAAGNRTLSEMYAMLKPVIRRVMETGKTQARALDAATSEHAALLDAMRDDDGLAFRYHISRHLDAGLDFIPAKKPAQPSRRAAAPNDPRNPGGSQ